MGIPLVQGKYQEEIIIIIIIIIVTVILRAAKLLTALSGTDRIPTSTLAYHVLFYLRWTLFSEGVEQTHNGALASAHCTRVLHH